MPDASSFDEDRPSAQKGGRILKPLYLNMRCLTQPLSGMQRYAEELASAVDAALSANAEILHGRPVVGLVPPGSLRSPDWRHIDLREIGRRGWHPWEQLSLARHARDGTLLSLSGSGPLMHPRHVLALHDANVFENPQFFSRRYGLLHRTLRPRLARRAIRLITITDFSRQALSRHCGVPPSRFTIIPDSAEHILSVTPEPEILQANGLVPGRYALCVGNQSPNKNIALAARAFAAVRPDGMKLAIAGGGAPALRAARIDATDWTVPLGRVSDGALRALYENAALFIFPSIYEGFGVPPLEAMHCGCPVVASDSSAIPEVLGDRAILFRSNDADACAEAIARVLDLKSDARTAMISNGKAHAATFSWGDSVNRLIALLREV